MSAQLESGGLETARPLASLHPRNERARFGRVPKSISKGRLWRDAATQPSLLGILRVMRGHSVLAIGSGYPCHCKFRLASVACLHARRCKIIRVACDPRSPFLQWKARGLQPVLLTLTIRKTLSSIAPMFKFKRISIHVTSSLERLSSVFLARSIIERARLSNYSLSLSLSLSLFISLIPLFCPSRKYRRERYGLAFAAAVRSFSNRFKRISYCTRREKGMGIVAAAIGGGGRER